jgi:hypothetical protein
MDELTWLHDDRVFLRREALRHGYSDRHLTAAVADRYITRVRHGAYTLRSIWDGADAIERHRLRARAVLRSHSSPLALSHTSAAIEHGLRVYKPDLSRVHVTCLDNVIAKTTPDVAYHVAPVPDSELIVPAKGPVLVAPLRAGLETASLGTVAQGVVVLDSVIDLGHAELEEIIERYRLFHGPGATRLQVTVRLVRKGSESIGESLARHLGFAHHLPEPVLQFEVRDEHGILIGRTDFAWPDHGLLGEFDGLTKYGRLLKEGETAAEAVVREKTREDRLREQTGWLMIRIIWAELMQPTATAARLRAQLERGRTLLAA